MLAGPADANYVKDGQADVARTTGGDVNIASARIGTSPRTTARASVPTTRPYQARAEHVVPPEISILHALSVS
ncbi:MAG: hypothetical protein NVS4B2_32310 [Chloroflexota bacterium]